MSLNILNNILDFFIKCTNDLETFMENNFNSPLLWIGIFAILLFFGYIAVDYFNNK